MADDNTGNVLKSVQEQYINKEYSKAIDNLLLAKDSIDPGLFHYNLGSLYIKQGNVGAARYNLEKSKTLGFDNGVVNKNISYIESRSETVSLSKSENNFESVLGCFTELSAANIGIISLLLSISILMYGIYRKVWFNKKLISLAFIFLIPFIFKVYSKSFWQEAVILKDIEVLEGPSKIFEPSGKIFSGSKVIISKEHQGWYFIKYPSRYAGWIKRDVLGLL